jgi:hypothetical protein
MRRLYGATLAMLATALAVVGVALADAPPPTTFVAVLTADQEVPPCASSDSSWRGSAVFHVNDDGSVDYQIVANNLAGTTFAAHIHGVGQRGQNAGILQTLFTGAETDNGVLVRGTFTNPALVAAMQANPQNYYVNVHTTPNCPPGAIRGQLGEHGPPGTAG